MAYVTNLQEPSSPIAAKPDYTSYVDYLEARGWRREQLTLDELNTNLVTLFGLAAGATGVVIDVRAPAGQKISVMGTQQIPRGADARTAHALRIRLADTTDTEINPYVKIRITKEKTSEAVVQLARVFYADVNLTKQPALAAANAALQKTDLEWLNLALSKRNFIQHNSRICVISGDNNDITHLTSVSESGTVKIREDKTVASKNTPERLTRASNPKEEEGYTVWTYAIRRNHLGNKMRPSKENRSTTKHKINKSIDSNKVSNLTASNI